MSCDTRKRSSGFLTRSHTNRAAQLLNMARDLKFRIEEEEVLYYQSSENKGADQLRAYREADLRLCFRICKKQVFSQHGSYTITMTSGLIPGSTMPVAVGTMGRHI